MSSKQSESLGLESSSSSLEETSQGAQNPADEVGERPHLGEMEAPLLGQRGMSLGEDVVFDVEHFFGSSPLFEGLDKEEVREVVNTAQKVPYSAGDLLFSQGVSSEALYIVHSGEVQVRAISSTGEEVVLALLGNGTVVGELALIDGGPRSATVEVISDCDVYRLSRDDFERLRAARRPAAYKIMLNLAAMVDERRRQTERRIEEVFRDPGAHIDQFEGQVGDMLARLRKV